MFDNFEVGYLLMEGSIFLIQKGKLMLYGELATDCYKMLLLPNVLLSMKACKMNEMELVVMIPVRVEGDC